MRNNYSAPCKINILVSQANTAERMEKLQATLEKTEDRGSRKQTRQGSHSHNGAGLRLRRKSCSIPKSFPDFPRLVLPDSPPLSVPPRGRTVCLGTRQRAALDTLRPMCFYDFPRSFGKLAATYWCLVAARCGIQNLDATLAERKGNRMRRMEESVRRWFREWQE